MGSSNTRNEATMIDVYVCSNGDVGADCTECNKTMFVPIEVAQSPFWDMYVGNMVLIMIQHVLDNHKSDRVRCSHDRNGSQGDPGQTQRNLTLTRAGQADARRPGHSDR